MRTDTIKSPQNLSFFFNSFVGILEGKICLNFEKYDSTSRYICLLFFIGKGYLKTVGILYVSFIIPLFYSYLYFLHRGGTKLNNRVINPNLNPSP